jgi:hypothetical protein
MLPSDHLEEMAPVIKLFQEITNTQSPEEIPNAYHRQIANQKQLQERVANKFIVRNFLYEMLSKIFPTLIRLY